MESRDDCYQKDANDRRDDMEPRPGDSMRPGTSSKSTGVRVTVVEMDVYLSIKRTGRASESALRQMHLTERSGGRQAIAWKTMLRVEAALRV